MHCRVMEVCPEQDKGESYELVFAQLDPDNLFPVVKECYRPVIFDLPIQIIEFCHLSMGSKALSTSPSRSWNVKACIARRPE